MFLIFDLLYIIEETKLGTPDILSRKLDDVKINTNQCSMEARMPAQLPNFHAKLVLSILDIVK